MNKFVKSTLMVSVLTLPMIVTPVLADDEVLNQRIERLERIIKGQGLISLLGRVDQLQQEVQRLNGDNEALRHQIELMKKRQREMYVDLDGRFSQLKPNQPVVVEQTVDAADPPAVIAETVEVNQGTPDVVNSTPTTSTTQPIAGPDESPVSVENGEAAYQAALQTLRSGQYEEAIAALSAFPEQYPQSHYVPNAYYWQGEANYVLRNFDLAIAAFQTVIERFPVSSKVPDAVLKQGFSQYELGQLELAKSNLVKVIEQYPTTSAARLAKVRLERLEQESR